ncbi:MAG: ribbon-helix-helix domain-containing protein [Deltaproteobacteria bacterium]|jgi:metal-responsive CopG/Arc/MetJ family transcriptional regulator|nr:ribbon-helix-helix domain-containing protein [Deltaproteobacteria bacterium]
MNTIKIAITVPKDLIMVIDSLSREKGVSRSKFIADILKEKISKDENDKIKSIYDRVFSDESIAEEQLAAAREFESSGKEDGQQW